MRSDIFRGIPTKPFQLESITIWGRDDVINDDLFQIGMVKLITTRNKEKVFEYLFCYVKVVQRPRM